MTQQMFADGISEISVVAGVVRIEFFVLHRKGQNAPAERVPSFSLAIPIEGFANSVPGMHQLLEKMVRDGAVKPRQGGAPGSGGGSPNFQ